MEKELVLEPMFEAMSIDQDKKVELQESFDKAVLVKTTAMMETYVEEQINEKEEILKEEYAEKVVMLESSLDGYLDTVVEEFITENAPSYEAQINDEKTKSLLEAFDTMVKLTGVQMLTIQDDKQTLDEAAFEETAGYRVDTLEEKVSELADRLVESKRTADKYLQAGLLNEMKAGLSMLEGEKFEKIANLVPFDQSASYLDKLNTLKESIIDSRSEEIKVELDTALPQAAFRQDTKVDVASALDFNKYI
ncbi:MAG: hypothetical protein J7L15_04755 [Clostridiales bacterium]|nr:hypothetical protein [Clostridiales bacterium]